MEGGAQYDPKVLNSSEDAHLKNMSTFDNNEHLRGCRTVTPEYNPQLFRHLDKTRPLRRVRGHPQ